MRGPKFLGLSTPHCPQQEQRLKYFLRQLAVLPYESQHLLDPTQEPLLLVSDRTSRNQNPLATFVASNKMSLNQIVEHAEFVGVFACRRDELKSISPELKTFIINSRCHSAPPTRQRIA